MEPKRDPEVHTSGGDACDSGQGVPQERRGKLSLDAIREALLTAQGQRDPYPVDPVSADLSLEIEQERSGAPLELGRLKDAVTTEKRGGKTFVMGVTADGDMVCDVQPATSARRVDSDASTGSQASADKGPQVHVRRDGEIVLIEAPDDK